MRTNIRAYDLVALYDDRMIFGLLEKKNSALWIWPIFFLAPFFWPNIFQAPIGIGLASFATGLFAAAWMHVSAKEERCNTNDMYGWFFLGLCLLPTTMLLIHGEISSPWQAWRQCLYLTGAWLVYAMSRSQASHLLQTHRWAAILTIIAHLYIIYAMLQAFDLRFLVQDEFSLFPVWSKLTVNFPGPLMQRNFQALFLTFTILFLWRQLTLHHKRWIWDMAAVLPICGLFLTASRSGVLILAIAFICVLLFSSNWKNDAISMLRTIIFGAALCAFILLQPTPEILGMNIIERVESSGISRRILIWDMNINLFLSHLWLGLGWGNLPAHAMDGILMALSAHPSLTTAASMLPFAHVWAHDIILQFLVEGGIFGGAAILMVLGSLGMQGWKWLVLKRECASDGQINGWIASVLLLAHGMVSVSLMQPFFMVLLALSLAASFAPKFKAVAS